jgi:hypothetical protein
MAVARPCVLALAHVLEDQGPSLAGAASASGCRWRLASALPPVPLANSQRPSLPPVPSLQVPQAPVDGQELHSRPQGDRKARAIDYGRQGNWSRPVGASGGAGATARIKGDIVDQPVSELGQRPLPAARPGIHRAGHRAGGRVQREQRGTSSGVVQLGRAGQQRRLQAMPAAPGREPAAGPAPAGQRSATCPAHWIGRFSVPQSPAGLRWRLVPAGWQWGRLKPTGLRRRPLPPDRGL